MNCEQVEIYIWEDLKFSHRQNNNLAFETSDDPVHQLTHLSLDGIRKLFKNIMLTCTLTNVIHTVRTLMHNQINVCIETYSRKGTDRARS
jgi:hypothetical protein